MRFAVEPSIFDAFPGMALVVAVAGGLDNAHEKAGVEKVWRRTWRESGEAARQYGNAQSHPHVAPWRDRFRAMGVSPKEFPSSIEALLRRALKGGEPFHINPLVDFYNAISLRHIVPAGGFDLADISDLDLRRTASGDTFQGLDTEERVDVPLGEVAYADGATVLTRHFVWRQSRVGLITPATRSVFLVSEILGEVGAAVAEAVCSDLSDGLVRYFGVEPQTAILSRDMPEVSWSEPEL
jgi:DNA/RNA-binding domain of Phe-tRNA-synthetase-like protein